MRNLILVPLLFLAACGGDDGGSSPPAAEQPATTELTTWYPSGRIEASGQVRTGTTTRHGNWAEHFDLDGNPLRWQGSYADGAIDSARPWTEWNEEGSVRVDSTDH